MAHRIVWSRGAVLDLDALTDYIAADSPAYAGVVLKNHCESRILARFPRGGRKVPEFDDQRVREHVVYSYRIMYRFQQDEALVVAVIHGKRILR